jgi:hypothetical protein
MEVTRRRKKLLDDLTDRRGYCHLKEEALDRTMWRYRFGGGFGPVVGQNTKWMNALLFYPKVFNCTKYSVGLLITFSYPVIVTYINTHVPFSLSLMTSILLLVMILSVVNCWLYNVVTWPAWVLATDINTGLYQCLFCVQYQPSFLAYVKVQLSTHSIFSPYFCSFANIGHIDIMCSITLPYIDRLCIFYLFLFVIYLLHDICFVMPIGVTIIIIIIIIIKK